MGKYMTPDHVCRDLQISRRTLQRWVAEGVFPSPLRQGQVVRFDAEEVSKAIEKMKTPPTSDSPRHTAPI